MQKHMELSLSIQDSSSTTSGLHGISTKNSPTTSAAAAAAADTPDDEWNTGPQPDNSSFT
jgi:hypothetical protein